MSTDQGVRQILEDTLTVNVVKSLWTANYFQVLPFTAADFAMEALLPAIFFMFRWGYRRGKGKFNDTFKVSNAQKQATIEKVAEKLSETTALFEGFSGKAEQAILGDILLCYCLENKAHKTGRTENVQRVYPTHYLTSWIDLPAAVANLRYIPEMLVSILVCQDEGSTIERHKGRGQFQVISQTLRENILLDLFGQGMKIDGRASNIRSSDKFDEDIPVGIDQLLAIRIAELCKEAPIKLKALGEQDKIDNQWPLATKAVANFIDDFNVFIQDYGRFIPRQSLLPMLESCLAFSLTNIYLSTASILLEWENFGKVPERDEQQPWSLFVDCSTGNDYELRRLSEESMEDCIRRFDRVPVIMMCLRILDQAVRYEPDMKKEKLPPEQPDATEWINLLGSIMQGNHRCSQQIVRDIAKNCYKLADALEEKEQASAACDILRSEDVNPVMRLAEAITLLMGDGLQRQRFLGGLDAFLMIDKPNGLAKKRRKSTATNGQRKTSEARSIILTNAMLDFLVHRHLRNAAQEKGSKVLSFVEFIEILRRYGFYVEQSPAGMSIPAELLLRNKRFLERRLRDLGLLIGVNDAESMKRLQPRFTPEDNNNVE